MLTLQKEEPEQTPVQTRDGRDARIIGFRQHNVYPMIAVFDCKHGPTGETCGTYTREGFKHIGMESDEDIVNLGAEAVERQYLVLDEKDPLHTPVMTRDGRPARLLCVDFKNPRYPIMAGVMTSRSRERALFYSGSGRACPEKPTKIDLVNKRPELESIKTT